MSDTIGLAPELNTERPGDAGKVENQTASAKTALDSGYRVQYFEKGVRARYVAPEDHSYHFEAYAGAWKNIEVPEGGSAVYLNDDATEAIRQRGPCTISSQHVCTVIPGYKPPNMTKSLTGLTVLPMSTAAQPNKFFRRNERETPRSST